MSIETRIEHQICITVKIRLEHHLQSLVFFPLCKKCQPVFQCKHLWKARGHHGPLMNKKQISFFLILQTIEKERLVGSINMLIKFPRETFLPAK